MPAHVLEKVRADYTSRLRSVLQARITEDCAKDHALWAEISATAARKPEVATVLDRMHEGISTRIAGVLGIVAGCPGELAQDRFAAPARLILLAGDRLEPHLEPA